VDANIITIFKEGRINQEVRQDCSLYRCILRLEKDEGQDPV